jgi:hypothetical protein
MKAVLKRVAAASVTLACLCAAAQAQGMERRRRADWRRLLAYAGRDVWGLEESRSDSLAALVKRLVPERRDPSPLGGSDFRARLEQLSRSGDAWVRQAAELALKPQAVFNEAWQ